MWPNIHGQELDFSFLLSYNRWMDDLPFYILSKVFQSHQNDGWMIMKGLCNGTLFAVEKISPPAGLEFGTARSVGQRLTH